jgi:hypothetical protein
MLTEMRDAILGVGMELEHAAHIEAFPFFTNQYIGYIPRYSLVGKYNQPFLGTSDAFTTIGDPMEVYLVQDLFFALSPHRYFQLSG